MAWSFSTDNAATVKRWSTMDTRDAEKAVFFYPMMFADKAKGLRAQATGMPTDATKGMIRWFTEFTEHDSGDRITIPHVPKVVGRGVHGDAILRGSGQSANILTQDLLLDFFATQVYNNGPLSDQRVALKFIDTMRPELAKWYTRKWEEAIVLALWGLTTWANTGVLENWNGGLVGESSVFNSPIETFDSGSILYAGDATSDASIDSADVLTANLLDRIATKITQEMTYPVTPIIDEQGQPAWGFVTSGYGIEQLKADSQFRDNHTKVTTVNANNPLTQRALFKYNGLYIIPYAKTLNPLANVGRSLVLGADNMVAAKHKGIEYFVDPADDAQRRKALSVTGSGAVKADKVGGVRRNALAVDHYVRTAS